MANIVIKHSFLLLGICFLFYSCRTSTHGIDVENWQENQVYAKHFSIPSNSDNAIILFVPGSGNSYIKDESLYGLVKKGYDVVSLAYKGIKDLPKDLRLIPIEYLHEAVHTIKSEYKDRKLVLMGVSKGAEYALTYASLFHTVEGLVLYSPSSNIFPHHVGASEPASSWVFRDEEIPYSKLDLFEEAAGMVHYEKYVTKALDNENQYTKGRIKAEQIKCPILLLSGAADSVWPAARMADSIYTSLNDSIKALSQHVSYTDCGHQFFWWDSLPPQTAPVYQSMNLTGIKRHKFVFGGTKEGTISGMIHSRQEVLNFLEQF